MCIRDSHCAPDHQTDDGGDGDGGVHVAGGALESLSANWQSLLLISDLGHRLLNGLVHLVAELAEALVVFGLFGLNLFERGQIFLTDQVGLLLECCVGAL